MNISTTQLQQKVWSNKSRIPITPRDVRQLYAAYGTESPSEIAKLSGLPYLMIYNLVHGRVRSVSSRHYLQLTGQSAPRQAPLKVDGTLFRAMADLWLYLNGGATRADLYRELQGLGPGIAVDHRIFNGKVKTVSAKLEHAMRQKFIDSGVDEPLLEQWLDEFGEMAQGDWVPYHKIRPLLTYIHRNLGVHPTTVLRQSVTRYETGELKRVSRTTFERIQALQRRTQKAFSQRGPAGVDSLREFLLGGKNGYTLFSEIEEELLFLRRHKGKGVRYYLGRSIWTYTKGKAKRIASWRARKIWQECERYISANPGLGLADLPTSFRRAWIQGLLNVIVARSSQLLTEKEGLAFEKRILRPRHTKAGDDKTYPQFIPFDMAFHVLGMKRMAFDLMVASHRDIFRSVGKYAHRWYLPDIYLRELRGKKDFSLISAKYESLARQLLRREGAPTCLN